MFVNKNYTYIKLDYLKSNSALYNRKRVDTPYNKTKQNNKTTNQSNSIKNSYLML